MIAFAQFLGGYSFGQVAIAIIIILAIVAVVYVAAQHFLRTDSADHCETILDCVRGRAVYYCNQVSNEPLEL